MGRRIEDKSLMSEAEFCDLTGLDPDTARRYSYEGKVHRRNGMYLYNSYLQYLGIIPKKRKGQR